MASSQNTKARQFHWVNKDAESVDLSRSHGSEAASILQFVQQNRKSLRQSRDREVISRKRSSHDFIALETSPGILIRQLAHDARDGTTTRPYIFRAAQSRWRLNVPVNNVTEGSSIDPFGAAIIPINANTFSLLQYAKSSIMMGAGGYKLEVVAHELRPMTEMYPAAMDYVLQNAVRHKHVMYPVLAAFSRRMRTLNDSPSSSLQNPDLYLHLATQAVRESIMKNVDNQEALSHIATGVHYLVCSTALAGRYAESRVHTQAFLKFLPYVDTKSLVGYWELDAVSTLDLANATATGEEPVIKIPTSDPGPLPASRRSLIQARLVSVGRSEHQPNLLTQVSSGVAAYRDRVGNQSFDMTQNLTQDLELQLGSALNDAMIAGKFHPLIAPTISKILECLMVAKLVWRTPEFATKKDTKWLCRRAKAVLHELQTLDAFKKGSTSDFAGQQAECLRLTLLIVVKSVNHRVLHLSRKAQAARLRTALAELVHIRHLDGFDQPMDIESDRQSSEVLLWMSFTGYWAAGEAADAPWFAESMIILATRQLGLRNFHDLEEVMLRHLYSRTAQQDSLMDIAAMISGEI